MSLAYPISVFLPTEAPSFMEIVVLPLALIDAPALECTQGSSPQENIFFSWSHARHVSRLCRQLDDCVSQAAELWYCGW